ncbi:MAG: alkaline phosphatase family protein [bacterium]|jgi:hypothetical protein
MKTRLDGLLRSLPVPAVAAVLVFALIINFSDSRVVLAGEPLPTDAPRHVLLIGWDGAQREHVREMLAAGLLPNLAQLASEGALLDVDITETTDTKAGWAQILSGFPASTTGVYSNGKYQPIPAGYTVFERLEARFGPEGFATLAVIGKGENVGADPPEWYRLDKKGNPEGVKNKKMRRKLLAVGTIRQEGGERILFVPGKPFYNAKKAMDLFVNSLGKNDIVGERALSEISKHAREPFFFFIHFAEVDSNGHKYGENSPEYEAALVSCDEWLGKIRRRLKTLGIGDALVYVTSDHGFDEGMRTHKNAPRVFLATNDSAIAASERAGSFIRGDYTAPPAWNRMDIAPAILDRYGMEVAIAGEMKIAAE